jgi:hypothetical protein
VLYPAELHVRRTDESVLIFFVNSSLKIKIFFK